jgi:hypothetical protein
VQRRLALGLGQERLDQVALERPHLPRVLAGGLDSADRVGAVAELDQPRVRAPDRVAGPKRARRAQDGEDLLVAVFHHVDDPLDVEGGGRAHLRWRSRAPGAVAPADLGDLLNRPRRRPT